MNAALYIVLILNGEIGATWGPLPYDEAECQTRIADRPASIVADGKRVELTWSCERHVQRPKLGTKRDS